MTHRPESPPDPGRAQPHRWQDLPADAPLPGVLRRRIVGTEAMLSRFELAAGCVVPSHSHANEQFACVLSGRVRFALGAAGDDIVEVESGGVLHTPSHVPHDATALVDSVVLDVFAPPSESTGVDDPGA